MTSAFVYIQPKLILGRQSSVWNLWKNAGNFAVLVWLVHVDAKNLTLFTQNLVQNLMGWFLASKTTWKWLKNCEN